MFLNRNKDVPEPSNMTCSTFSAARFQQPNLHRPCPLMKQASSTCQLCRTKFAHAYYQCNIFLQKMDSLKLNYISIYLSIYIFYVHYHL